MLQKASVVTLEVSLFKQPGACMAMVMVVLPTCRGSCATDGSKLGFWKATIETHLPAWSSHSADTGPGLKVL